MLDQARAEGRFDLIRLTTAAVRSGRLMRPSSTSSTCASGNSLRESSMASSARGKPAAPHGLGAQQPEPVTAGARGFQGIVVHPGAKSGHRRLLRLVVRLEPDALADLLLGHLWVPRRDQRAQRAAVVRLAHAQERVHDRVGGRHRLGALQRATVRQACRPGPPSPRSRSGRSAQARTARWRAVSQPDDHRRLAGGLDHRHQVRGPGMHVVRTLAARLPGAAVVIADDTVIGCEVGGDRVVDRRVKDAVGGQHDERALAPLLPVDLDPVFALKPRHARNSPRCPAQSQAGARGRAPRGGGRRSAPPRRRPAAAPRGPRRASESRSRRPRR